MLVYLLPAQVLGQLAAKLIRAALLAQQLVAQGPVRAVVVANQSVKYLLVEEIAGQYLSAVAVVILGETFYPLIC